MLGDEKTKGKEIIEKKHQSGEFFKGKNKVIEKENILKADEV